MVVHLKAEKRRRALFKRVWHVWVYYGDEYRTILSEYETLLTEKRNLKIVPLCPIKMSTLQEFPDIAFLDIADEKEALEYLLKLTLSDLVKLDTVLDLYLDSFILITLRNRIADFKYAIRNHNCPKTPYGLDPDNCVSKGGRVKRPIVYREDL